MVDMEPEKPQAPQQPVPPTDPNQPVAYDQYGRPLYAHPPAQPQQQPAQPQAPPPHPQPQMVQVTRPIDPIHPPVSPEIQRRHEESAKKYKHINLSTGEYVLSAVKRHPIGLLKIWVIGLALIVAFMALYFLLFAGENPGTDGAMATIGMGVMVVMIVLTICGTLAATYVYDANRFYLTNESVIQEIQTSLFSRHEQTVSLSNIEDASFKQGGILPVLFNYGTIRLSTEGDETTYRFSYVSNPKNQIAILNNAVEAFKNGRPVGLPED